LVLDASAILAYVNHYLSVGETLGEVIAEDGALVALPAVSLAQARLDMSNKDELAMLGRLLQTNVNPVVIAPLGSEDPIPVAGVAARLNADLPLAHAVDVADRHGAQLMTAHGSRVRAEFGEIHGIVDV
jgi:hypothetical protein